MWKFTGNLYKAMNFLKEYCRTHDVTFMQSYGRYLEVTIDGAQTELLDFFRSGHLTLEKFLTLCGKTAADFSS